MYGTLYNFITVCNILTNPEAPLDNRYSVEHKRTYLQQNYGNLLSRISLTDEYLSGWRKLNRIGRKGIVFRVLYGVRNVPSDWFQLIADVSVLVLGATALQWPRAFSFTRFLDHTQRHTTVGRTPLDEWLARRIDLYLTTHNTHNRQMPTPPVGFEPTISAGERLQTYTSDCVATGTGKATIIPQNSIWHKITVWIFWITGFYFVKYSKTKDAF